MPPNKPQWLDVVRHRIRGFRAPYLLILQHHDIPASTRLAAPVTPSQAVDVAVLSPLLIVAGRQYRARLLDTAAVNAAVLGESVESASDQSDAIMNALDIILHGYPVGLPC
jgi:hypothetical protein